MIIRTLDDVTSDALAAMQRTEDQRLREIMTSLVKHLHAFVREVELTPAEWIQGLQFLTAVGQACTPIRQEFILLSDVLGVSAVVNALHDLLDRFQVGVQPPQSFVPFADGLLLIDAKWLGVEMRHLVHARIGRRDGVIQTNLYLIEYM